jgi:hypothetical protein
VCVDKPLCVLYTIFMFMCMRRLRAGCAGPPPPPPAAAPHAAADFCFFVYFSSRSRS